MTPAGTADAVVPSRWVQPGTWLCAQAGGQLVAEVPGRTGGSAAKTQWKSEAYCYTPAQALGGTVATWTSVPGAGFEADHATSDWITRTACCHGGGMEWFGSAWSHRAHHGVADTSRLLAHHVQRGQGLHQQSSQLTDELQYIKVNNKVTVKNTDYQAHS